MKKSLYAIAWVSLLAINNVTFADAASDFWGGKVLIWWEGKKLDIAIQWYITTFSYYLSVIAVIYALYGGFNILTAGWEEEKVKKGKTIITHAIIWLFVIFLAKTIINFALWLMA